MNRYKMKRIVMVFLLLPALCLAFQNEPDGFRGMKWGTDISTFSDMSIVVDKNDDDILYTKKNENLNVGDVVLTNIYYGFYEGKLYSVWLHYTLRSDFSKLKDVLFQKYGPGEKKNRFLDAYEWRGSDVVVGIDYNSISEKGSVIYFYLPIVNKKHADDKEKAKKAGKDL